MWFAVRIKPQREFIVQEQLTKDGFHVYFPTINARRRVNRHGRKMYGWQEVPLLPGLIFVAIAGPADGVAFDDLRSWPSVSKIMADPVDCDDAGGNAKPVAGAVIDHIRALENEARHVKKSPAWQPSQGERVRVSNEDHHLYGIELVVDEIRECAKRFKGTPLGWTISAWLNVRDVEAA